MWTRVEVKNRGKAAFRANYWPSVLAAFLLTILTAGTTAVTSNQGTDVTYEAAPSEQAVEQAVNNLDTAFIIGVAALIGGIIVIAMLLNIFVFNPLKVGCYAFFRENVSRGDGDLNVLKDGFQSYGRTFITMLLTDIFLILWTLLLIIPGIVKSYSYRMVPFIIRDNPELEPKEVITRSREMMNGHKWAAFKLDLSFIGWFLLAGITLGLAGVFWVNPYYYNTNAALYLAISGDTAADAESAPLRTHDKPEWEL